ncbi:MAG: gliding motility lipoprotein GldJ [Cytophagales bacterium]|nr:gliding motility lipoprotein GldJ [Cytophagales bacterium]
MKQILGRILFFPILGALIQWGCGPGYPTSTSPGQFSTATGLPYNDLDGFELSDYEGQPDAPNMVFIEGGRTVLGSFAEDIAFVRDNLKRTVTIASFYMDETEIANVHWLEYLYYVQLDSTEEVYRAALPDTTVWARELSYNDSYVLNYLRYPGFRYYPVVGITWRQANDYCRWRTRVVNLRLAEDSGYFQEELAEVETLPLESGAVVPNIRLPTEAEWEYAAQGLIGTQFLDENFIHNRIYPWNGHWLRYPYSRGGKLGHFYANFKRGRGDFAGIAGKLNDGAMITTHVYDNFPNDYGLYNMAGNVNEWVWDVYRPLSFQDFEDLNPVRRNGFLDEESGYDYANYNSLISNKARVYKGGSWADVAYWLSPGNRRFLEEDSATATIGFRCALIQSGTRK